MAVTCLTGAAAEAQPASVPAGEVLQREYARCAPSLYRYAAVRLGDPHLAEDLVQQLWLQASGSRQAVREDEIEFWLRGILLNLIRTHWRRLRRRPAQVPLASPALADDLAKRLDSEPLPDELLSRREVKDQLLLALTALAASDQELLLACYFEQRSQAELSRTLGISVRAVEGRLYRARAALKARLQHLADDLGEPGGADDESLAADRESDT